MMKHFEGLFWIAIYHTATPLLKSRLKEVGCIVYQGDETCYNWIYALFDNESKMNRINSRYYRSVQMILGTYKGYQSWLDDGHYTKLEL